jgi:hypothetical protein
VYEKRVTCIRCGNQAIIKSAEGELFPTPGQSKARVTLFIDCPACGLQEQAEALPKAEDRA